MKLKMLSVAVMAAMVMACGTTAPGFSPGDVVGTWSGLLFQTEPPIESIELHLHSSPPVAVVRWRVNKEQTIPLRREASLLTYSDKNLRLDVDPRVTDGKLHGVLTYDLWAQGLQFTLEEDTWTSHPPKPEIIDTDYRVYLEFYKDQTGELQAHIQSNKENRELHFVIDRIEISGSDIDFELSNPRFKLAAEFDPSRKRLYLDYGNSGGTRRIELSRLAADKMEGYLARAPGREYRYQVPVADAGSWPTASMQSAGIDPALTELVAAMDSGDFSHVHSVLVARHGKLVFEEYFHGYDREYLHDTRSAFKSIAALLLGKVLEQDQTMSVQSRLLDFYPEYATTHPEKRVITLQHALTMTTGITLEDEDAMQWGNDDWVGYKLGLPLAYPPGEKYEYTSGGANLLSGVIENATGQYLPVYLQQQLLLPMGIERFQMLTSPSGRGYLAGNFHLRAVDLAKIGQLVLDEGRWQGRQVIDPAWIREVITARVESSWPKGAGYGYLWRILERKVGGRSYTTVEAWGNGGQFLIVIPELDAVVVFTGGNYNLFPEMEKKPFTLLEKYILPALSPPAGQAGSAPREH